MIMRVNDHLKIEFTPSKKAGIVRMLVETALLQYKQGKYWGWEEYEKNVVLEDLIIDLARARKLEWAIKDMPGSRSGAFDSWLYKAQNGWL